MKTRDLNAALHAALQAVRPKGGTLRTRDLAIARELISTRTRAALAAAKARGVRLGRRSKFDLRSIGKAGNAVVSAAAATRDEAARWAIEPLYDQGLSLRAIAAKLKQRKVLPARGDVWHASAVGNAVRRLGLRRE